MPATVLQRVQLGKEGAATWGGTGIRATVRLIGVTEANFRLADEVNQPEQLGWRFPAGPSAQVEQHAEGTINQTVSYQDVGYWLDGVFGAATGSQLAGTQYIYKWVAGTSTTPTPRSYTAEYGQTSAVYNVRGVVPSRLELSIEAGNVMQSTVELLGKVITTKAFTTAALAIRTVQLVRAADTTFQIGAWANSTYTNVAATLISARLTAAPGRHLKTFMGSLTPGAIGAARWEGQLVTVCEFNASAKAYVNALQSGLVQRRIKIANATTTPLRGLNIEFAGTLTGGTTLFTDRDGNMTVELTWNGTYSSTLANFLKVDVTNELATLP